MTFLVFLLIFPGLPIAFAVLFHRHPELMPGAAAPAPVPPPYSPISDPTYMVALEALETATVAAPGPDVSFEVYLAPGALPGITAIMGCPVMHSRAVAPGSARIFDRLALAYVG